MSEPILEVRDLVKEFPVKGGGKVHAVSGVSFDLVEGETLGMVGESGCGKSTTARCVLRLIEPDGGRIEIGDLPFSALSQRALRPHRRRIQMVFQDPLASLNPRRTVGNIIAEGPITQGEPPAKALDEARILLKKVGLPTQAVERYPHEFSGGQRQRIAIARALVLKPRLVVLDEPTSALDVSVQAQVVDLLRALQAKHRLAYLFISHDLGVVRAMAHRIVVLKDGVVVEEGEAEALTASPRAPYTRALMAAAFDLRAEAAQ